MRLILMMALLVLAPVATATADDPPPHPFAGKNVVGGSVSQLEKSNAKQWFVSYPVANWKEGPIGIYGCMIELAVPITDQQQAALQGNVDGEPRGNVVPYFEITAGDGREKPYQARLIGFGTNLRVREKPFGNDEVKIQPPAASADEN